MTRKYTATRLEIWKNDDGRKWIYIHLVKISTIQQIKFNSSFTNWWRYLLIITVAHTYVRKWCRKDRNYGLLHERTFHLRKKSISFSSFFCFFFCLLSFGQFPFSLPKYAMEFTWKMMFNWNRAHYGSIKSHTRHF